jgi:hypothetical protein
MEVYVTPETAKKLKDLATTSGRAPGGHRRGLLREFLSEVVGLGLHSDEPIAKQQQNLKMFNVIDGRKANPCVRCFADLLHGAALIVEGRLDRRRHLGFPVLEEPDRIGLEPQPVRARPRAAGGSASRCFGAMDRIAARSTSRLVTSASEVVFG